MPFMQFHCNSLKCSLELMDMSENMAFYYNLNSCVILGLNGMHSPCKVVKVFGYSLNSKS